MPSSELSTLLQSWDKSPLYFHYMVPLIGTFIFGRILMTKLFQRLPPSLLFKHLEPKHETDFINSSYYAMCLIISVMIGEMATSSESWRTNFEECFIGWPYSHEHSFGIKFYVTYCVSFYLYSIGNLFVEDKKRDFTAMLIHHIATITTIGLSGYAEHYRIGIVIMLLFDSCDIALEIAKIFSKCKEDVLAILAFSVFVLLWARNRLYLFPFYIMPCIINGEVLSNYPIPYFKLHLTVIYVILFLQAYWTYFIIKKFKAMAKLGLKTRGDPREDTK